MGCSVVHRGKIYSEENGKKIIGIEEAVTASLKESNNIDFITEDGIYATNREAYDEIKEINQKYGRNIVTVDENTLQVSVNAHLFLEELLPSLPYQGYIHPNLDTVLPLDQISKLNKLQASIPNVKLIIDNSRTTRILGNDTGEYKKLIKDNVIDAGQPVLSINPALLDNTSLLHEFGHIYIDALIEGGYGDFIKSAIDQLQDSNLYKQVTEQYPELDVTALGKEVLAQAIGEESDEVFNSDTSIGRIITRLLDALKRLLGIEPSIARQLARDLVLNQVRVNKFQSFSAYDQEQRANSRFEAEARLNNRKIILSLDKANRGYYVNKAGVGGLSVTPEIKLDNRLGNTVSRKINQGTTFRPEKQAVLIAKKEILKDVYSPEQIKKLTIQGLRSTNPQLALEVLRRTEEIQGEWRMTALMGTGIHAFIEDVINGKEITYLNYISKVNTKNIRSEEYYRNQFQDLTNKIRRIKVKADQEGSKIYVELPIADIENDTIAVIDMMILRKDGSADLYDFKTLSQSAYRNNSTNLTLGYKNFKMEKHAKQLLSEKRILEKEYGIKVKNLHVIPLTVDISNTGELMNLSTTDPIINIYAQSEAIDWEVEVMRDLLPNGQDMADWTRLAEVNVVSVRGTNAAREVEIIRDRLSALIKELKLSNKSEIPVDQLIAAQNIFSRTVDEKAIGELMSSMVDIIKIIARDYNRHKNNLSNDKINQYNRVLTFMDNFAPLSANLHTSFTAQVGQFLATKEQLKRRLVDIARNKVADLLVEHTKDGIQKFERAYQEEFLRNNPVKNSRYYLGSEEVSRLEHITAEKTYVRDQLFENRIAIQVNRKRSIEDYIIEVTSDAAMIEWALNASKSADLFIKTINEVVKKANDNIHEETTKLSAVLPSLKKMIAKAGTLANSKLYEDFLALDEEGNPTEYLIGEYNATFQTGLSSIKNAVSDRKILLEEASTKVAELMDAKEAATTLDERLAIEDELLAARTDHETLAKVTNEMVKDWYEANTEEVATAEGENKKYIPLKSKYQSAAHLARYNAVKDHPVYKFLVEYSQKEDDLILAQGDNLSNKLRIQKYHDTEFIRLPSISMTTKQKIAEVAASEDKRSRGWGQFKEAVADIFKPIRVDSDEVGDTANYGVDDEGNYISMEAPAEPDVVYDNLGGKLSHWWGNLKMNARNSTKSFVQQGVDGKIIKLVPIKYRGYLGVNREEHLANLSYDLLDTFSRSYLMAVNFSEKEKVKDDVEILSLVSSAALTPDKTIKTAVKEKVKNTIGLKDSVVEKEIFKRPGSDRRTQIIENYINDRIYSMPIMGNIQLYRLTKRFNTFIVKMVLAGKGVTGAANLVTGILSNGYDNSPYSKIYRKRGTEVISYAKDMVDILADLGRVTPKSKTNLMLREFGLGFDTLVNVGQQRSNVLATSLAKFQEELLQSGITGLLAQEATINFGMSLLSSGEHMVTGSLIHGIVNNLAITNHEGKYLDKNFNVTDKVSAVLSDFITVVDGKLVIDERVNYTELSDLPFKEGGKEALRHHAKGLFETANGNYLKNREALGYNHPGGLLLGSLKKWFADFMFSRYGYFQSPVTGRDNRMGLERDEEGKINLESIDKLGGPHNSYNSELGRVNKASTMEYARYLKSLGTALFVGELRGIQNIRHSSRQIRANNTNSENQALSRSIKINATVAALTILTGVLTALIFDLDDDEEKMEAKRKLLKSLKKELKKVNKKIAKGDESSLRKQEIKDLTFRIENLSKTLDSPDGAILPRQSLFSGTEGGKTKPNFGGIQYKEIPIFGKYLDDKAEDEYLIKFRNTKSARKLLGHTAIILNRLLDEQEQFNVLNTGNAASSLSMMDPESNLLTNLFLNPVYKPLISQFNAAQKITAAPIATLSLLGAAAEKFGKVAGYEHDQYSKIGKNDFGDIMYYPGDNKSINGVIDFFVPGFEESTGVNNKIESRLRYIYQ